MTMPRWTDAELQALRQMAALGEPDHAIAVSLGRTAQAVYCQRARHRIRSKLRRPWTTAELNTIRLFVRQGCTDQEIAAEVTERHGLYRSTVAVRHARRDHGIDSAIKGRPVSLIRQARIMDHLAEGMSLHRISRLMRTPWRALRVTVEGLIRAGLVRREGGLTSSAKFVPAKKWKASDSAS